MSNPSVEYNRLTRAQLECLAHNRRAINPTRKLLNDPGRKWNAVCLPETRREWVSLACDRDKCLLLSIEVIII